MPSSTRGARTMERRVPSRVFDFVDLLEPVLPALLPAEISRNHFLEVFPSQKMLQAAAGGGVTDNQDPLTVPPKRQIGEKTAHPVCCLSPTFAAGVGQIEVSAAITMNLGSGRTVQLSATALPEPPVHQNRYVRACKGHLHRFDRSPQVRNEDCDQPVVATPLPERRCVVPPGVGEAARKPPSRYSLLVVLSGRVRFVDDLYGHDADIAHEAKNCAHAKAPVPPRRGSGAFFSCSPRTELSGKWLPVGRSCLYRCNALTSSCLPSVYLGLPGSLPVNPRPSALRMAIHLDIAYAPLPEPSWIPRHQCALGSRRLPESKDPCEPRWPDVRGNHDVGPGHDVVADAYGPEDAPFTGHVHPAPTASRLPWPRPRTWRESSSVPRCRPESLSHTHFRNDFDHL